MLPITYANAHRRLLHVQEQQTRVRLELAIVVPQGLRVASLEKLVSLELASVEPRAAVLEFRQGRIVMLPITYVNVHRQWLRVVEQQIHVLLELAIVVLQVLRAVTAVKPVSLERVCVERAPLALVKQPELSVMQPITYVNVHPQSLPAQPAQNAREEPVFVSDFGNNTFIGIKTYVFFIVTSFVFFSSLQPGLYLNNRYMCGFEHLPMWNNWRDVWGRRTIQSLSK